MSGLFRLRLISPAMSRALPVLLSLALFASLLACDRRTPPAHPPVIIISVDTLRSDHLPAYGARSVETPAIDALARDSIVYEHAYSHCPLTLPSHATIFTGLLPATTGVRDNLGFHLRDSATTLAEVLKRNGYATGAAVSAYVLRADTGAGRGFDSYDDRIVQHADQPLGAVQRSGMETEAIASRWIAGNSAQPFFFLLHLYEPHTPYDAPEPFRSHYVPYDAEIAQADAIVGKFIAALRARDLYDRALIVFLSDHGEGLGDHGEDEHGIFLYREAIQVPLMIKLPASHASSRDARVAGLSDVMPTILDVLGIAPPAGIAGRSLLAKATTRSIYSETFYPRFHYGWSDLHSLTDGAKHYIEAPTRELYDLTADPAEKTNIAAADRRMTASMQSAIAPLMKDAADPAPIAADERAKLAALGYVTGQADVSGPLPDPKDKRDTLRAMREAFALFRSGKNAETVAALQPVLRDNPHLSDAWEVAAKANWRSGRAAEAIAAAKEGLKNNPRSSELAFMIGEYALRSGDVESAEQHAALVVASDPPRAHELLARISLARGDVRGAEEHARIATGAGQRAEALVTLARVLKQEGHFEEALKSADEAAQVIAAQSRPPIAGLSYLRGDLLARLGRNEEAEGALRQEIAMSPADGRAYQSLILLLASEGRTGDATQLIYELIRVAPSAENFAAVIQTLQTLGDSRGARYWSRRGLDRYPNDRRFRKFAG